MVDYIKICEEIADKNNLQGVVLLTIKQDGTIIYSTYGDTKKKCNVLGKWTEGVIDHILSVWPFRTHFGWGNKGVPKPLTENEQAQLTANELAYMEHINGIL